MKQARCVIIIDGSNFYFKLKDLDLHYELQFDFSGFAKLLAGKNKIARCVYYVGAVRTDGTKHTQKLFNKQQKLFANLKKHNFQYSLGYLLKSGGKMHEKGVDVNMAVDIVKGALKDEFEHFIIVSSDTDLLPAILVVKEAGKTIEYIGFSHQASLAMVANCSESRLLKKEDLLPFVSRKISPKK
ncbi:NYN domain-containing protein [Candidatus Daviesbacteria bacterium]|nr:NYN domain-containing protein [Candidatus Daviesbacteria bacterium]